MRKAEQLQWTANLSSAASAVLLYKALTTEAPSIIFGDLGSYHCTILQTDSSLLGNANRYEVQDATAKPILTAISLPSGQVGFSIRRA